MWTVSGEMDICKTFNIYYVRILEDMLLDKSSTIWRSAMSSFFVGETKIS